MDATLHGCHPAIRQSLAPIPPPKIDEAPTFDQYGKLAQLFLISTGKGGTGSVAAGKPWGKRAA